ncbi:uncharacterized protein B0H64DRAFT_26255 [Chaetomium fimeti]|uniref:RBR-type E3 ubiquitin transferase n=1 Tax=Chaetomium fimeti TaxID=1854472 RepID=A0AAE0HQI9_9PEZI|nr:hypothetical protein B0H64DRAFT_26255 [Chaetomium fimeti]
MTRTRHVGRQHTKESPSSGILTWVARAAAAARLQNTSGGQDHPHTGPSTDRHRGSGTRRPAYPPVTKPIPTVRIVLRPLDPRYCGLAVTVPKDADHSCLVRAIRKWYDREDQRLATRSLFRFYDSKGKQLDFTPEITSDETEIWYSVSKSERHFSSWKFSDWADREDRALDVLLAAEILSSIGAGVTVGELRQTVADQMGIQDANRVALIVRDGMRPGALQGNHWCLGKLKTWLCRWISIALAPERGYVILRGVHGVFVYHPRRIQVGTRMHLSSVADYITTRVFQSPYPCRMSELSGQSDLELDLDGTMQNPRTATVKWGATYDFRLSHNLAEAVILEGPWTMETTKQCSICIDDKSRDEMPVQITPRCTHQPTACKDCLGEWLRSSIERGAWDRLHCPDCPEVLSWQDVKRHAPEGTFNRYDTLVTRATLTKDPTFHFCLSPACGSGQMYEAACPRFECISCQASSCLHHRVAWHTDETCEAYDKRNQARQAAEKASEKAIRGSSKPCPKCQRDVHKFAGCNHITCLCRHEWCYICSEPWQRLQTGAPYCRHATGCTERDALFEAWEELNPGLLLAAPGPQGPGNNNNNNNDDAPPPFFRPPLLPPHDHPWHDRPAVVVDNPFVPQRLRDRRRLVRRYRRPPGLEDEQAEDPDEGQEGEGDLEPRAD